jgi:hypothetical protein
LKLTMLAMAGRFAFLTIGKTCLMFVVAGAIFRLE